VTRGTVGAATTIGLNYLRFSGGDCQFSDLRVTKTVLGPPDFLAAPSIDVPEQPATTATWTGAAGDRRWANAANWTGNALPTAGQAVYLDEKSTVLVDCDTTKVGALVSDGFLVFSNATARLNAESIVLRDQVFATCAGPFGNSTTNRIRFASTDFTMGPCVNFDLTGRGFTAGAGPGVGTTTTSGSSHGGLGALTGKFPNDDVEYPILPGSGGTSTAYGGGAVEIRTTGTVTLEGTITANGTGGSNQAVAGAGGSILVTCTTLKGTGATLKADGATNYKQDNLGGNSPPGSGGRIALHYTDATDFAPARISVLPGRWLCAKDKIPATAYTTEVDARYAAQPGTIWLSDATPAVGFGTTLQGGLVNVSSLTFDGDTTLTAWAQMLEPGAILTVNGNLTLDGTDARLSVGWSTNFVRGSTYDSYRPNSTLAPKLVVSGDLSLTNSARIDVYSANVSTDGTDVGSYLQVGGNIRMEELTRLTLASHCTGGQSPLVTAQNITVASNATVTAYGLGFGGSKGPGCNNTAYGNSRQGGSYGGKGGITTSSSVSDRRYGSEERPDLPGSGSHRYAGAGYVHLAATGTVVVNGSVTANGIADGEQNGTGASSSGGGILIDCKTFAGTGSLTANGGKAQNGWSYHCGGGGGGRIAVYAGTPWQEKYLTRRTRIKWFDAAGAAATSEKGFADWTGTATAAGGTCTTAAGTAGEDGTVVFGICPGGGLAIILR